MSDKKWTLEQQDAISARGGPLLVSAAAGSGKTAVLVERVVSLILDSSQGIAADRLLVVTFTKAAAAEMKDRIDRRLSLELQKHPNSTFLQRQKILLSHAQIGTIDSFCKELIQENFSQLGVPVDFRVADQSEMKVLQAQTMTQVLDRYYAADDANFLQMADSISSSKNDRQLTEVIQTLYQFARSHPFPRRWLQEKADMYRETNPDRTEWGSSVRKYAEAALSYSMQMTEQSAALLDKLGETDKLREAQRPVYEEDWSILQCLRQTVQKGDWDAVYQQIHSVSWERMPSVRGYQESSYKLKADANRKEVKKTVEQLKHLFCCKKEECREDFERLLPVVSKLVSVTETFSDQLNTVKKEKKILDFSDLEHLALQLLVQETPDGWKRTPEADSLSQRYDEVLVDEYQDTNELQDLLFRAISQEEKNLFMVGDVKQSIYGFRQAEAGLFLERRSHAEIYCREAPTFPSCITLGKNFRSRVGIIAFVNFLFRQLMSKNAGGLEYAGPDELLYGGSYPESPVPDAELDVLECSTDDGDLDQIEAESRRIAEYITNFLENGTVQENGRRRKGQLRDVCILLRSAKKYAPQYARILSSFGVPTWASSENGFFETSEIRTALSFLRTADNPLLDIPLLAVLASPVYGFTPDELASIRMEKKKGPVYLAVRKKAAAGNTRCQNFLEDLQVYRAQAATLPADRFLLFFLQKSGYQDLVLAMDHGETRLANLHLLIEYARKYEQSSAGGLSGFIHLIDRMQREGSDLSAASPVAESADVVHIMSIHHSKGLEFPVVILAGCSRRFHQETNKVCLNAKLGFGLQLQDEESGCRYTTLPHEAVSLEQRCDGMSEELRVLYVAVTRAKERLLILCSGSNVEKKLTSCASKLGKEEKLPAFLVQKAGSTADWILLCALRHPNAGALRKAADAVDLPIVPCSQKCHFKIVSFSGPLQQTDGTEKTEQNVSPNPELYEKLKKETEYIYPYLRLGQVRAKTAASEIAAAPFERKYAAMSRPAFLGKGGLTPAERGTALHAYMQYVDYKTAASNPEAELERLYKEAYLTKEQADAVDINKIKHFFASPLAKRILNSKKVLREYRFTIEIPASRLDISLPPDMGQEPVVVQGAIDCAFEEADGLVLLDYKTDREKNPDKLRDRYQVQLMLYKEALTQCTGMPVKECLLYTFSLGKTIILSDT